MFHPLNFKQFPLLVKYSLSAEMKWTSEHEPLPWEDSQAIALAWTIDTHQLWFHISIGNKQFGIYNIANLWGRNKKYAWWSYKHRHWLGGIDLWNYTKYVMKLERLELEADKQSSITCLCVTQVGPCK